MFDNVWYEKYRPKTLDDIILSPANKTFFSSLKEEVPHLLFVGTPGIGKTTLARIIVHDILKCQYLYINASDENGIDTIRTKVSGFSQIKSLDGGIKVVILDEADGITLDGQKALRNTIEEYTQYTRFILTANYKHKIVPALQSRTQSFDLTPPFNDVVKRMVSILNKEKVKVSAEQSPKLLQLIKDTYPDIRKTVNNIQKFSVSGELNISGDSSGEALIETIHAHVMKKQVVVLRRQLIENEVDFQGDYSSLLKRYLNYIYSQPLPDEQKRQMIIIIAEHLYKDVFVVDKEINAFACFCQLAV